MTNIATGTRIRVESRLLDVLKLLRSLPLPVSMMLVTLALGIAAGMSGDQVIAAFNHGFGASIGEFALILIPSFVLAAALGKVDAETGSGRLTTLIAPFAGAGMVCPDTAYAALSPVAGRRKLSVAFGSYAGFKLLVPAGPTIVATALGAFDAHLALAAIPVFAAAWATGLLYARHYEADAPSSRQGIQRDTVPLAVTVPIVILATILVIGFSLRGRVALAPAVDLLLTPKGALLAAATAALAFLPASERLGAVESGMRRTAPLLLTIGTASAFGYVLITVLPFARWGHMLVGSGLVLPALFAFAALFKTSKGSSMATFAGTGGIVAALMPSLGISPVAATLALCAGAFVTIGPNDSLYWLIRQDALKADDARATRILAVGATLQGLAAMVIVLVMHQLTII